MSCTVTIVCVDAMVGCCVGYVAMTTEIIMHEERFSYCFLIFLLAMKCFASESSPSMSSSSSSAAAPVGGDTGGGAQSKSSDSPL